MPQILQSLEDIEMSFQVFVVTVDMGSDPRAVGHAETEQSQTVTEEQKLSQTDRLQNAIVCQMRPVVSLPYHKNCRKKFSYVHYLKQL